AHHADDKLETFFINLSRGSGIKGLTGIPVQRDKIIRPLLPFTKKQIRDYVTQQQIAYRQDSSNRNTDYLRNAVRAKILPAIYEVFPNFQEAFSQSTQHLLAVELVIKDWVTQQANHKVVQKLDHIRLTCDDFETKELRDAFVYYYLQLLKIKIDDTRALKLLPDALSGKQLETEHAIIQNDRGDLLIFFKKNLRKATKLSLNPGVSSINLNDGVLQIDKVIGIDHPNKNNLYLDADKLSFPLEIRSRKSGDFIYPVGMQGKKTLKKLYIDLKIPKNQKEAVSILTSNDQIVWIIGKLADRRFLADENSSNILKFTWNEA
ncbi:MAG: tRNA lysidine(34) synthetase TilS, partial [Flavobacteriaceae bacterium]|nr:tRNA lysidine(34) synthetase TilS [Flavobacteriaceae bacterium]